MKSTCGWDDNGKLTDWTDAFGFSALPGGYVLGGEVFRYAGKNGSWWTATEKYSGSDDAHCRQMNYSEVKVGGDENTSCLKSIGISVRCVKN